MSQADRDAIIIKHLSWAVTFNRHILAQSTIYSDCVRDLAALYGDKVNLHDWESLPPHLAEMMSELGPLFRTRLRVPRASAVNIAAQDLLRRYQFLTGVFFRVAERRVSTLDEYGDENWAALDSEATTVIVKIGLWEGLSHAELSLVTRKDINEQVRQLEFDRHAVRSGSYRLLVLWQARNLLMRDFRTSHEALRNELPTSEYAVSMKDCQLAVLLSRSLETCQFEPATWVPPSGYQGADVIGDKSGNRLAIQAKCYRGPVGSRAVQEVVAAREFYGADAAWIITYSSFTGSARRLAQIAEVELVDGSRIGDLAVLLGNWPRPVGTSQSEACVNEEAESGM